MGQDTESTWRARTIIVYLDDDANGILELHRDHNNSWRMQIRDDLSCFDERVIRGSELLAELSVLISPRRIPEGTCPGWTYYFGTCGNTIGPGRKLCDDCAFHERCEEEEREARNPTPKPSQGEFLTRGMYPS